MLEKLHIKNFALIEELNFEPPNGLSVITGETGAGKSIMFDALGLALGDRADQIQFFNQDSKCVIEAYFNIDAHLKELFLQHELDFEPQSIFRRELLSNGKSRLFINDTPTKLNVAKEVGSKLISIHNQHESIGLFSPSSLLLILDEFAQALSLRSDHEKTFNELKEIRKQISQKQDELSKQSTENDYLNFLLNELEELNLSDEDSNIESQLGVLTNAEEIKSLAYEASNRLMLEELGILTKLEEVRSNLVKIGQLNPESDLHRRAESLLIELKDLAQELIQVAEQTELDEERLQIVQERFHLLQQLYAKHGVSSVDELIDKMNAIALQLNESSNLDDEIQELISKEEKISGQLSEIQTKLSKIRREASFDLQTRLLDLLNELELPNAVLKIELAEVETHSFGNDKVQLLFSSNQNLEASVVTNAASGGELSRLALAIKSIVAGEISTLIFDEIDSGVSGRVSKKIGSMLKNISSKYQVISITHSPQVAASADHHFFVSKSIDNHVTSTVLRRLGPDDRVESLAQMLSGEHVTQEAKANAKTLLNR